jgi:1-acyl-sn-glycerol-3-phosphate acyltransferase
MAVKGNLWYHFIKNLSWVYFRLFHDLRIQGMENIPSGGFLMASNHESFFDPPLIGCALQEDMFFLARKTLFDPPGMNWFLPSIQALPIDQERPDMTGLKRIIALLKQGERVALFPEGARNLDGKLQPAAPGVGLVLSKVDVPVVPCRILGGHAAWPRNGKPRLFMPLRVVYGKPLRFPSEKRRGKDAYQAIGDEIMRAIAALEWTD